MESHMADNHSGMHRFELCSISKFVVGILQIKMPDKSLTVYKNLTKINKFRLFVSLLSSKASTTVCRENHDARSDTQKNSS